MSDAHREMTLDEWVNQLVPTHRARRELDELRARLREPAGVGDLVQAARNAAIALHNCVSARQIGDGYNQLADDVFTAIKALASAPQPPAEAPTWVGYSIDADPAGIRARVADTITGVLGFGAQGSHRPPAGHWLEPFWDMARADAVVGLQAEAQAHVGGYVAALRVEQARAVMPLIGPLLDAWERVHPDDSVHDSGIASYLDPIKHAMTSDEAIPAEAQAQGGGEVCKNLSDADMDRIVGWLAQQEAGAIGWHEFCDNVIREFGIRSASTAPPSAPVGVEAEVKAYEAWFAAEQGKPYDGAWQFARAAWLHRAALAQPRAADDSTDYRCPDCGKLNYKPLGCANCGYELPVAAQQPADREEMSPDFTDSARAAIAWVLYHHQGGSSPVGQPLRFALGMGADERLPDWRIAEAKRWAEWAGATTADFHRQQPAAVDGAVIEAARAMFDSSNTWPMAAKLEQLRRTLAAQPGGSDHDR